MFDSISYELILGVHIIAFVFNIALVVISDFLGLMWVAGKMSVLPNKFIIIAHRAIWFGLSVSIVSGYILFSGASEYLLTVPAFYTKVIFVLALLTNSFLISSHIKLATSQTFKETSVGERWKLFISGGVSFISWVGVVVSAQFLGL